MQKEFEKEPVIINVDHLTKDYGYGRGVFDVSIKVHRGECYGYLGPNGAGKSTTIRHIMGFSKPQKGSTQIFGIDTFGHTDEILGICRRMDRKFIPLHVSLLRDCPGCTAPAFCSVKTHRFPDEYSSDRSGCSSYHKTGTLSVFSSCRAGKR